MRRLIAALLLLLPLAAACDLPTTPQQRTGKLTGTLNGQPWAGTAEAAVYRDTLYINSGQHVTGSAEQRIGVAVVPNGQGGYSVVPPSERPGGSHYWELIGGDVITYSAQITQGTIIFTEYGATRTRGSLQLTISGSRGVWQFSGQFDAPREDVP
ncbi:MAG TPA: hypothetical protein VGB24_24665 [Longimicrobium sp.]|uniref:hypothetical protein n=1 Tax=Longimicrobium sp. TaxID=2029185 RepID=UPI002EDB43AA